MKFFSGNTLYTLAIQKLFLILACLVVLLSCNNQNRRQETDFTVKDSLNVNVDVVTDSTECESAEDTTYRETLNDIRFEGWGKEEWADNEYIREVRRYIDAYNKGEITDTYLDEYKEYIQGKFAIADIQPYIAGGALIYIIFYDNLEKTFSSVVYSSVDEETRVISNYECKGLKLEDYDLGFSQEDIQQFLKECPEQRLW